MPGRTYTVEQKLRAISLHESGVMPAEIGEQMGIPRKRVHDWLKRGAEAIKNPRPRGGNDWEAVAGKPVARCFECGSDEGFRHFPACEKQETPWQRDNVLRLRGEVVTREQCRVRGNP